MKIFLPFLILLFIGPSAFSQDIPEIKSTSSTNTRSNYGDGSEANNNVYIEGSFVIQSINYERKLFKSNSELIQINARIGFGYFELDFFLFDNKSFGGLGAASFLLGKRNNHLEVDLGLFLGKDNYAFTWPIATIGYRYQKAEGGLIFKSHIGMQGVGIGLGYAF